MVLTLWVVRVLFFSNAAFNIHLKKLEGLFYDFTNFMILMSLLDFFFGFHFNVILFYFTYLSLKHAIG